MKEEPLLQENPERFVIFPLQYPKLYSHYLTLEASFWALEDIDFSFDETVSFFSSISSDTLQYLHAASAIASYLLTQSAQSSLPTQLATRFQAPEVRFTYSFLIMANNVETEAFSHVLKKLIALREPSSLDETFTTFVELTGNSEKFAATKKSLDELKFVGFGPENTFVSEFAKFLVARRVLGLLDLLELLLLGKDGVENAFLAILMHVFVNRTLEHRFNVLIYNEYLQGNKTAVPIDKLKTFLKSAFTQFVGNKTVLPVGKLLFKKLANDLDIEGLCDFFEDEPQESSEFVSFFEKWEQKVVAKVNEFECKLFRNSKPVAGMELAEEEYTLTTDF